MKIDWKEVVGSVAPTIATALGGPLAGVAVKALGNKILGKTDATEEDVSAAIAGANPETLLQLKQAELEFKKSMSDAGIQLEKLAAEDRASARKREIDAHDVWTPRVLGGIVVLGFLLAVYFVLSGYVTALKDPTAAAVVGTVIGYISAKADQVVAYYFGSSAGSKTKDAALADIAKMP